MIEKAKAHEKDTIHRYWKEAFHHDDGGSVDSYFKYYYNEDESYVMRNEVGEIITSAQVRSKVLSLNDTLLRVSYVVGLLTVPKYQGKGHMKTFMNLLLEDVSKRDLVTVLMAYEPKVYESLGFETVIEDYEYNIDASTLYDFDVQGIMLNPQSDDLVSVYRKFTSHFDGYFLRDEKDFDLLNLNIKAQNGAIVGLSDGSELLGYCIYIKHASYVEVVECCYDKSGTLMRLLSFVTRGKSRLVYKASTQEQIKRLFPKAKRVKRPFLLARINDKELFERLYNIRIISAYSAFHAFEKPLFNRDFL